MWPCQSCHSSGGMFLLQLYILQDSNFVLTVLMPLLLSIMFFRECRLFAYCGLQIALGILRY